MIWTLSNVPVERQKIMCAGKTLKDEEWNIPLKNVREILRRKKIASSFRDTKLKCLCLFVGCNFTFARNERSSCRSASREDQVHRGYERE